MPSAIRVQSNPRRVGFLSLLDVVFVSDPEQIRRVEESGAVDRLHAIGTKDLPFWVKWFLSATRFWDPGRDLWFLNLEPGDDPDVASRRQYLLERIEEPFKPDEVRNIVDLLHRNASNDELSYEMAQVVNRRFFGADIPAPICKAARKALKEPMQVVNPWKTLRARMALAKVRNYCAQTLPPGVHLVDVGHNIGETVETAALALKRLKENVDAPLDAIFTRFPLTPKVPRIAVASSTIGPLLNAPTIPGKTVFILEIGKAARQTGNPIYTFSAGSERACLFGQFFIEFMRAVQKMLREGAAAPEGGITHDHSP